MQDYVARMTSEPVFVQIDFLPRTEHEPAIHQGHRKVCLRERRANMRRLRLRPVGHNVRLSPHTWDPQLNAARYVCICSPASFIGDYFGVDARGGYAYTSSVSTYNEGGRNPLFDQQQDVARLKIP